MSELVKIATLSDEEKTAFVRHTSAHRYVLARRLKDRPWDTGSIWRLVQDPSSKELCIARVIEKETSKEDQPTGLDGGQNHAVHAMMKTAGRIQEAPLEASETIGTGLPDGMTTTADYFWGKVLPTVNAWCAEGFADITPEGIRAHAVLQVKMGKLTQADADLISLEADRVIAYAKQYSVDQSDLFDSGTSVPSTPSVGHTHADKVLASLATLKPARMPWPAFLKALKGLKS